MFHNCSFSINFFGGYYNCKERMNIYIYIVIVFVLFYTTNYYMFVYVLSRIESLRLKNHVTKRLPF